MGLEEGAVTLAGDEELDEEEEEAVGGVRVERTPGAEFGASWLDLSGKGGCGGWEGAAGVKAEDSDGMEATLGAAGEEVPPPNGRAVLL